MAGYLLSERIYKVRKWLAELPDMDMAELDKSDGLNEKTLEIVEFLQNFHLQSEQLGAERDQQIREKINETKRSIVLIRNILRPFKSSMDAIRNSKTDAESLHMVAKFLSEADPNAGGVCLLDGTLPNVATSFVEKLHSLEHTRSTIDAETSCLRSKLLQLSSEREQLEKDLQQSQQRADDQRKLSHKKDADAKFYHDKIAQYKNSLATLEKELYQRRSYDPASHSRSALTDNEKRINELTLQLEAINKKLEQFHGLPPNLDAAKVKLAEAKEKFQNMDRLLDAKLLS